MHLDLKLRTDVTAAGVIHPTSMEAWSRTGGHNESTA